MARKKKLLGEEFGKMVLSRMIATYRKSNQSNGMGLLDGVQVTVF